jgi:hypothetical protein
MPLVIWRDTFAASAACSLESDGFLARKSFAIATREAFRMVGHGESGSGQQAASASRDAASREENAPVRVVSLRRWTLEICAPDDRQLASPVNLKAPFILFCRRFIGIGYHITKSQFGDITRHLNVRVAWARP